MRIGGSRLVWSLAACSSLAACTQDARSPEHDCLVHSPDNVWSNNKVTMKVTSPRCPVQIPQRATQVYFASDTRAPNGLQNGPLHIAVYDDAGDRVSTLLGIWSPISGGLESATVTGHYLAGNQGLGLGGIVRDFGIAAFVVKPQFGTQASAQVEIPYKLPGMATTQSLKLTSSQNMKPKIGVPTWVEVVPQIDESFTPVQRFEWYFDNKKVIDTARMNDPRFPPNPGRWFQAKVHTRGNHTWKVTMFYGSINQMNATVVWTQTYY